MNLEESNRYAMNRITNISMRAIEVLKRKELSVFLRRALAYTKPEFPIHVYALIKVRKTSFANLNDLVDFCFYGVGDLIMPLQIPEEILGLLRILNERKPRVVIEIGTAMGGTLFLFCRVADKDATIISIDLPGGMFGGGYYWWRIPLYKRFTLPKQKLHLLRADSHSEETLDKVMNILGGKKADFLFIDGDHSYDGVRMDFEMFSPLVKEGGIIAFHDIVVHPAETGCKVSEFWDEIKKSKCAYSEIVGDWNQGMDGIGLLQWLA